VTQIATIPGRKCPKSEYDSQPACEARVDSNIASTGICPLGQMDRTCPKTVKCTCNSAECDSDCCDDVELDRTCPKTVKCYHKTVKCNRNSVNGNCDCGCDYDERDRTCPKTVKSKCNSVECDWDFCDDVKLDRQGPKTVESLCFGTEYCCQSLVTPIECLLDRGSSINSIDCGNIAVGERANAVAVPGAIGGSAYCQVVEPRCRAMVQADIAAGRDIARICGFPNRRGKQTTVEYQQN